MAEKLKITRGSGNVFLDIGFSKAEAENLKLRAELMMRIEDFYRKHDRTELEDFPEAERRHLIVRLWLRSFGLRRPRTLQRL